MRIGAALKLRGMLINDDVLQHFLAPEHGSTGRLRADTRRMFTFVYVC
jgi:hypothetical protein